jgi:tRNA(Ile)-lysidine synthase
LALGEGWVRPGERAVVAVSGGLDSVVLLHLLRFGSPLEGVELHAAHFDHAMRAGSRDDMRWVVGLCRAWGVELHAGRADAPPASEEEAREARYDFLGHVRTGVGARLVLTAHHADDQAETVLFRALRGTGRTGLGGIPARRDPGLWRPLLGFWREELERYAERARISWREDPTNTRLHYARNALRRRIIPEIEQLVAPRARRALVRLADLAREDEAGWESVLPTLMAPLGPTPDARGVSVDRSALLELHPAVRARILRALATDLGVRLDETGTRLAVDFAGSAASGRRIELGGGWTLVRELDRLVLRAGPVVPADQPLRIPDVGPGEGQALLAGERVAVAWGDLGDDASGRAALRHVERFDPTTLRFPLFVRAREPGDRIRLAGGTKKVKKLFLERRMPEARRGRTPLVVDAEGEVLWIPEVARAEPPPGRLSRGALGIGIG